MIKRLQRKFVAITMGSLFLILLIIVMTLNGINYYQINQKADGLLGVITENNGKFPELDRHPKPDQKPTSEFTEETPFETRYFIVKTSLSGFITEIDTGHVAAISPSDAQNYAQAVLDSGKVSGYMNHYKFLLVETEHEKLIAFVDCRSSQESAMMILLLSIGVALGTLIVMFILISIFSRKAIRPVIESLDKQRQFITDASHEIKTPLAIISANTEVLELTAGRSEWTDSIRRQTERLTGLVQDMLMLARMEESQTEMVWVDFSLSDAVEEAAFPFRIVAENQKKEFSARIHPGLTLKGDESGIRQLVSILVDNAVKYSSDGGSIRITLDVLGRSANLRVCNTVDEIPANLEWLFDRFYRADSSRSRETGGYGIGLSVARAVAESHKGKIQAKAENGNTICFQVMLPIAGQKEMKEE